MRNVRQIIAGRPMHTVRKGRTVREVVQELAANQIGAVPVMDGNRLAGVFSERDLISRVLSRGLDLDRTRVEDVMTVDLVTAHPGEGYDECLSKMNSRNCRHLPVLDEGTLVGFLSLRDLLAVAVDEKQMEVSQLSAYISSAPAAPLDSGPAGEEAT
jgi:CBS domain-containing protein